MAKKTVLKRSAKTLPTSSKDNRFQMAVYYDNLAEAGKLKFDERTGNIIEGEVSDEPADKPAKEIKNYAAPNTVEPVNEVSKEASQNVSQEPANDSSQPEAGGGNDSNAVPGTEGVQSVNPADNSNGGTQDAEQRPTDNDPPQDTSGGTTASSEAETAPDNVDAPNGRADLQEGIKQAIDYLGWGFAQKMRFFKDTIGSSNIGNMSNEQLQQLYIVVTDLAEKKTQDEANADDVNNTSTDSSGEQQKLA